MTSLGDMLSVSSFLDPRLLSVFIGPTYALSETYSCDIAGVSGSAMHIAKALEEKQKVTLNLGVSNSQIKGSHVFTPLVKSVSVSKTYSCCGDNADVIFGIIQQLKIPVMNQYGVLALMSAPDNNSQSFSVTVNAGSNEDVTLTLAGAKVVNTLILHPREELMASVPQEVHRVLDSCGYKLPFIVTV